MNILKIKPTLFVSSNVSVKRAGYANFILLLLIIGLILINHSSSDFGIALFIRGVLLGFCLFILKVNTHSVSKFLSKDGKSLVLIGPFSDTEIGVNEIFETKVYGIPSSMTIFKGIKKSAIFVVRL